MNIYIDNISDAAIEKLYGENWDSFIDSLVVDFTNVNNKIKSKIKVNMFLDIKYDIESDEDVYVIYYKNLETNMETRAGFGHVFHVKAHLDYLLKISMIL